MTPEIQLPNWPPRRLVTEALFAWGCRHLDEEYIDCDSAPWPVIRMYAFLTRPKTGEYADGKWARAFVLRRDGQRRKWQYDFYSALPLPPNRIEYVGIQCPRCGASVAQRKQLIDLGQGYSRVDVWSCHCLTYAFYRPYGWRPAPLTLEEWKQMVQGTERKEPQKEP